jgi:hypothetical protein
MYYRTQAPENYFQSRHVKNTSVESPEIYTEAQRGHVDIFSFQISWPRYIAQAKMLSRGHEM